MKIYTKTGDRGTTSLVGGKRVDKDDARLEAYGTIDELNSHIGMLAADGVCDSDIKTLRWIQNKLFDLGAYLATEPESSWQPKRLTNEDIERIESAIDGLTEHLPQIHQFILPGGAIAACQAHVCRCVARRAERRMVTLSRSAEIDDGAMKFINRLSDYFFTLAKKINLEDRISEICWDKNC